MSKLSCDIIRDLIPSYIDEICSEESRRVVQEHLETCSDCRESAQILNQTQLVDSKLEVHTINHMKKVKKHFIRKNMFSFGLLLVFMILGLGMVIVKQGDLPIDIYYVAMPIVILSSYLICSEYVTVNKATKREVIVGSLGIFLILYTSTLAILIEKWANDLPCPFGLHIGQMGPFLYKQLLIIGILHMGGLIIELRGSIHTKASKNIAQVIHITGIGLAFGMISILKRISMTFFIAQRNTMLCAMIIEGIIIGGMILVFNKSKTKSV